ncbi:MAG: LemA family protein [Parcubacteria group bacterium]|nr:LemA family protein [Parcubacteria group bacterium]
MTAVYIILGIVAVIILWFIFTYNRFIVLKNRVQEAWSDIEVQFKRRYDLIPNLVNTVKGYAGHEKEVFDKVTQARAQALGAKTIKEHGKAENMLSDTLKSLFAVSEAYPELKANTNFLELQRELVDTEDKIQAARRFYNSNVIELNNKTETFPSNIIAGIFKFQKSEFFDADAKEEKPVAVKF